MDDEAAHGQEMKTACLYLCYNHYLPSDQKLGINYFIITGKMVNNLPYTQ